MPAGSPVSASKMMRHRAGRSAEMGSVFEAGAVSAELEAWSPEGAKAMVASSFSSVASTLSIACS